MNSEIDPLTVGIHLLTSDELIVESMQLIFQVTISGLRTVVPCFASFWTDAIRSTKTPGDSRRNP